MKISLWILYAVVYCCDLFQILETKKKLSLKKLLVVVSLK